MDNILTVWPRHQRLFHKIDIQLHSVTLIQLSILLFNNHLFMCHVGDVGDDTEEHPGDAECHRLDRGPKREFEGRLVEQPRRLPSKTATKNTKSFEAKLGQC